jgi:hypothetical protein
MADYKKLIQDQVAKAFELLKQGNLTKEAVVRYFVSEGKYDAETDKKPIVWDSTDPVTVIVVKPSYGDVKERNVVFTDAKLLVPGTAIPKEPDTDTDRVLMDGREWNIRKSVGVPGEGIYILFVNL